MKLVRVVSERQDYSLLFAASNGRRLMRDQRYSLDAERMDLAQCDLQDLELNGSRD